SNENTFSFSGSSALAVCWRLQCRHATTAGSGWTARPVRTDWPTGAIRATGRSGADWGNWRSSADRAAGRHRTDRPDRTAGAAHATALVEKHNARLRHMLSKLRHL